MTQRRPQKLQVTTIVLCQILFGSANSVLVVVGLLPLRIDTRKVEISNPLDSRRSGHVSECNVSPIWSPGPPWDEGCDRSTDRQDFSGEPHQGNTRLDLDTGVLQAMNGYPAS